MKKTLLILTVLLIAIKTFAQSVSYPDIDRKVEKDVYIKKVNTTDYSTQITFVFQKWNNCLSEEGDAGEGGGKGESVSDTTKIPYES